MSESEFGGPVVQCAIDTDMFAGGVRIVTRMRTSEGKQYMRIGANGSPEWETVDPHAASPPQWDDPVLLKLPDEVARALLDALSAWYSGTSISQATRADLEREAGRVDKMLAALMAIATGPTVRERVLPPPGGDALDGDALDELRDRQRREAARAPYGGVQ